MTQPTSRPVEPRAQSRTTWRRLWPALGLLWCCSCGADEAVGQSHTVDASLWTAFAATVTESGPSLAQGASLDDAAAGLRQAVDVWSVDQAGLAQYASTNVAQGPGDLPGRPQVLAVRRLDGPALVRLQNALSRYRVFSWDSTITCSSVVCAKNPGLAVLDVNLNGQRKTVTWPLYAEGLPDGLEQMAQTIKDASSDG